MTAPDRHRFRSSSRTKHRRRHNPVVCFVIGVGLLVFCLSLLIDLPPGSSFVMDLVRSKATSQPFVDQMFLTNGHGGFRVVSRSSPAEWLAIAASSDSRSVEATILIQPKQNSRGLLFPTHTGTEASINSIPRSLRQYSSREIQTIHMLLGVEFDRMNKIRPGTYSSEQILAALRGDLSNRHRVNTWSYALNAIFFLSFVLVSFGIWGSARWITDVVRSQSAGVSRCGCCGYPRAGLRGGTCPECGRAGTVASQ